MVENGSSSYTPRKCGFRECFSREDSCSSSLDTLKDTKAALNYLLSIFPRDVFVNKLPAIALKHQVYSIITDRTRVDRELNLLRDAGEIRFFKLDSGTDEFAIVNSKDFMEKISMNLETRALEDDQDVKEFLVKALPTIKDVSVEKSRIIRDFGLSDHVITSLMNLGIVNLRGERSLWISIPFSAMFMKSLIAGRKAVLSIINKMKYKEIFRSEPEQRDIKLHSKLDMSFHIHDIIGGDMVMQVSTTNGTLLRSVQSVKKRRKLKIR